MKSDVRKPDPLKALEEARRTAMAREEAKAAEEPEPDISDLSVEDCMVRLTIEMYASQLKVGLGVMPDGMACYARLSYPSTSSDPRRGMVSFCVSNDHASLLLKCMVSLDSSATSKFWKADRFAG